MFGNFYLFIYFLLWKLVHFHISNAERSQRLKMAKCVMTFFFPHRHFSFPV